MQINIGLLGFGVVGVGVYETVQQEATRIKERTGISLTISRVLVSDIKKHNIAVEQGVPLTDTVEDILSDDSIDVIVEVMGGMEPAATYLEKAMKAGKQVVTANKELLASKLEDFLTVANEEKIDLCFEASVGGAVPILHTLNRSQVVTPIHSILGIVNGTTNYMVTQMTSDGATYDDALKKAQELGFAEADPTGDVSGWDATYKMMILGRLAYGTLIQKEDLSVTGITNLIPSDFSVAAKNGYTVKLIGRMDEQNNHVVAQVSPTFVSLDHPLSTVQNEMNAVTIKGQAFKEMTLVAPGAGRFPTAHSILTDIVQAAVAIQSGTTGINSFAPKEDKKVLSIEDTQMTFICRLNQTKDSNWKSLLQEGDQVLLEDEETVYVRINNQKPSQWLKHPAFVAWFPVLEGENVA